MRTLAAIFIVILPLAAAADVVVPVDKVESSVNIRLQPDATSEIVGRLNQGESIPWVNSEPGWHEVQLEGDATGFISADWSLVQADENVDEGAAEQVVAEEVVEEEVVEEEVVEEEAVVAEVVVAEVVAEEPVEEEVVEAEVVAEEPVEEEVEPDAEEFVAAAEVEVEEAAVDEAMPVVVEEAAERAEVAGSEEAATVIETVVVTGPPGPAGPPGPPGAATIKGSQNFLVRFKRETEGGNSQIYDNGNQVGIGTTEPKQRLEVNGSIQIHEQNSSVAGLMITQSSGDTGYIMHNLASTLTIGAGSQDRLTIDRDGNVGIAVSKPNHPLEMASGAYVSAGGVWTNSSSRRRKENIADLTPEQAMAALLQLEPVIFNYKNESSEEYVGFIAEDVPNLVANNDRQSLSAMDIVAVLTKVVQQQQQQIEDLENRLGER